MIAARIFYGETAEEIGISVAEYADRRATLVRYLAISGGQFDRADFLNWLQADAAGDRGNNPEEATKSIRIIGGPKPSGKRCCGGGKIR